MVEFSYEDKKFILSKLFEKDDIKKSSLKSSCFSYSDVNYDFYGLEKTIKFKFSKEPKTDEEEKQDKINEFKKEKGLKVHKMLELTFRSILDMWKLTGKTKPLSEVIKNYNYSKLEKIYRYEELEPYHVDKENYMKILKTPLKILEIAEKEGLGLNKLKINTERKIRNEELVFLGIPDLEVYDEKKLILIDFKSSYNTKYNDKFKDQLGLYKKLIQIDSFENREIVSYVYHLFPEDKLEICDSYHKIDIDKDYDINEWLNDKLFEIIKYLNDSKNRLRMKELVYNFFEEEHFKEKLKNKIFIKPKTL